MTTEKAKLTLYFIPSPFPLDWSSPTSLARTILKNRVVRKQRFMGHVNIRLEYGDTNILTGMVTKDLDLAPKLLLKEKIGLGIIYHSFKGHLEEKEELEQEFDKYYEIGNKRMNYVEFLISESMAKRVHQYLDTFKEQNLGHSYGLINSPLHGEGAGCSAFGASFMIMTGLLNQEMKDAWSNTVRVPKFLTGAPMADNKISFFKLLFKNFTWANENEDHHELFFWDPDLMWSWVEEKIANNSETKISTKKVTGIQIDYSDVEAPSSDIFKIATPMARMPDLTLKSNLSFYK